jgi:hypothetical protein
LRRLEPKLGETFFALLLALRLLIGLRTQFRRLRFMPGGFLFNAQGVIADEFACLLALGPHHKRRPLATQEGLCLQYLAGVFDGVAAARSSLQGNFFLARGHGWLRVRRRISGKGPGEARGGTRRWLPLSTAPAQQALAR